jgi:hypothetical protein
MREKPARNETRGERLRGQRGRVPMSTSRTSERLPLRGAMRSGMEERVAKMKELCRRDCHARELRRQRRCCGTSERKSCRCAGAIETPRNISLNAFVEVEAEESAPKLMPSLPRRPGNGSCTTAYIRYSGGRTWALSEVANKAVFRNEIWAARSHPRLRTIASARPLAAMTIGTRWIWAQSK